MADRPSRFRHLAPLAALGLAAVALVAFALGVTAHGGTALAADPSGSPAQIGANTGWTHMSGFNMGGRGMGAAGVEITITAINGSKLSLQTTDGWTRTIDATGATVTKGSQTIALGDLKVGDTIAFREARQSDGSYKITSIQVVLPHVQGTVSSVGPSSVTITQADGSSKTIQLTGSTTYQFAGGKFMNRQNGQNGSSGTASKADLVAGVRIEAEGTTDSSGTFTATTVQIAPATVSGTVASKTADSIVVTTAAGKSVTIKVTATTKFAVAGATSANLASIATGDEVMAEGTLGSDGSLTASIVAAWPVGQPGFMPGMGRGHMGGGFHPGFGPGSGGTPANPGSSPAASNAPSV